MLEFVHLKNFKNFSDVTLKLGPLTVIVGTNASGKSNLRDAFRFLHGMGRGYSLADIIGGKYGEGGELQWKGIRGGTKEIALNRQQEFSLEIAARYRRTAVFKLDDGKLIKRYRNYRAIHSISVDLSNMKSGPRVCDETLTELKYYYHSYSPRKVVYASHDSDDPPPQEGSPYFFVRLRRDKQNRRIGKRLRFLDNRPVLTQFPDSNEASPEYRRIASSFSDQLESMRFLDLSPDSMKTPSIPGQTVLGDRGENLSSVMKAIFDKPETRKAVTEWIRELTPLDVSDFDFVSDQTGRILLEILESNGHRTSAYSASDGTLRFLAIIAALLGPEAPAFMFLEEIDTGIHPSRLYLLLQLLEEQAKTAKTQVVITTHSPQLLGMLSKESREHASLVYRLPGSPEGHIKRIMDIPAAKEVLETQNLGRLHESGWLENAVVFSDEEAQA